MSTLMASQAMGPATKRRLNIDNEMANASGKGTFKNLHKAMSGSTLGSMFTSDKTQTELNGKTSPGCTTMIRKVGF